MVAERSARLGGKGKALQVGDNVLPVRGPAFARLQFLPASAAVVKPSPCSVWKREEDPPRKPLRIGDVTGRGGW